MYWQNHFSNIYSSTHSNGTQIIDSQKNLTAIHRLTSITLKLMYMNLSKLGAMFICNAMSLLT